MTRDISETTRDRRDKQAQRRRKGQRLTVEQHKTRKKILEQVASYPLDYLPTELTEPLKLTALQIALLHLITVPNARQLGDQDFADILNEHEELIKERGKPCSRQAITTIRTRPKFIMALNKIMPYVQDMDYPAQLLVHRDQSLEGDVQSTQLCWRQSGKIQEQKQLTGANIILVGNDLIKQGFAGVMDSLSGKKQIEAADAEVIDDE